MKHKTLPHLFEESVNNFPDNIFLREKKKAAYEGTTYADAYKAVRRTARGLLSIGLERGDRVALISEGRNDWVISELAILFAGAICVPLSVKIEQPSELQFRLEHSGCKGVIVSRNHQHKVFHLLNKLPELVFVVVMDPLDEEAQFARDRHSQKIIYVDRAMGYRKNILAHLRRSRIRWSPATMPTYVIHPVLPLTRKASCSRIKTIFTM